MQFKQNVKGERLLAAIIDGLIIGVISSIFSAIFMPVFGITVEFDFTDLDSILNFVTTEYIAYTVTITIIMLIIGVIYFGMIPAKNNGQTFGKKIMKIKVINKVNAENPTFFIHAARSMQMWQDYVALPTLAIYLVGVEAYITASGGISTAISLLVFVSLIMILASKEGQGIHDHLFNTLVVDERYTLHSNENSIIEDENEEKKFDPFDNNFESYSKKDDPWNE